MTTSDGGGVPGLRCTVTQDEGSTTIVLVGEVDLATSPQLATALAEAQATDGPVTLDLAEVTYFDSSGVGVLVEGLRRGPIQITCAGGIVRRVLEVCGFADLIIDQPS